MKTPAEFYRSLPSKRMASGVLLLNDRDEVLILKTTYEELRAYKFAPPAEAAKLLDPNVGDRLLRAIEAYKSRSFCYFEGRY